jgi:restriction system protein
MIRAGEGGYLIDEFSKKNLVAIGWNQMGDLTNVKSQDALKQLYRQTYPQAKPGTIPGAAAVIQKFCNAVQKNDAVVSYDPNKREYLIGQITSDYYYKPGVIPDYPNIRDVNWQNRVSRDELQPATRNSLGSTLTLFAVSPEAWEDIQSAIKGEKPSLVDEKEIEKTDFEEIRRNRIEEAHESIKDKLLDLDAYEMQELVAAILRAMGFKPRVSPPGSDRGLDIFASPDGLGLQEPRIKAEVKHRQSTQMGSQEIRSFVGGLRPGDRALYVSTGGFSKEAKYEAERSNIPLTLIELDDLATLVEQHYENFDTNGRALIPLTKIYWPSE